MWQFTCRHTHVHTRTYTDTTFIHSTGLHCSVYWSEICRIWCGCVGVWQCHWQLHGRLTCELCTKVYVVLHLHWVVSVLVSVSDLLQESGELSSYVFSLLWIKFGLSDGILKTEISCECVCVRACMRVCVCVCVCNNTA